MADYTLPGICETILTGIEDVTQDNPATKKTPTGYIDFLRSDFNQSGVMVDFHTQRGTARQFDVTFLPRVIPAGTPLSDIDAITCSGETCDDTKYVDENVQITSEWAKCFHIDVNDFRTICETDGQFFQKKLAGFFDACAQELNGLAINEQAAEFGVNKGNGDLLTVASVNMIDATNGGILANGWTDFMIDMKQNLINQPVAIIGHGNLVRLNALKGASCCATTGVDFAALMNQWGYVPFEDLQVETELGNANDLIVAQPGASQFITYNQYTGAQGRMAESSIYTTIADPRRENMVYDMRITHDCDTDRYQVRLSLFYRWWVMPDTVYAIGDYLRPDTATDDAVNGTFYYNFASA